METETSQKFHAAKSLSEALLARSTRSALFIFHITSKKATSICLLLLLYILTHFLSLSGKIASCYQSLPTLYFCAAESTLVHILIHFVFIPLRAGLGPALHRGLPFPVMAICSWPTVQQIIIQSNHSSHFLLLGIRIWEVAAISDSCSFLSIRSFIRYAHLSFYLKKMFFSTIKPSNKF